MGYIYFLSETLRDSRNNMLEFIKLKPNFVDMVNKKNMSVTLKTGEKIYFIPARPSYKLRGANIDVIFNSHLLEADYLGYFKSRGVKTIYYKSVMGLIEALYEIILYPQLKESR